MKNSCSAIVWALLFAAGAAPATSQSVRDRTPDLSGGWVSSPGILHFNFLHRFTTSGRPERQVLNSPTFLLAYAPLANTLVGAHYATRSDIVARYPNEWEVFARYAPRSSLSFQAGYNNAAQSVDAEVSGTHNFDRLKLLAAARVFSNAYDADTVRFALAGGAVLRLTRWISIGGDVVTLLDRRDDEDIGWGGALQIAIPYTPHTLSLQATNTGTGTLEGSSRGARRTRYGFEFTVPVTLARWFGNTQPVTAGAVAPGKPLVVMKNLKFSPATITITPGDTVTWRNDDQVPHTVTARDASWTSALIPPGGTYQHAFSAPGRFEIVCMPHPVMKSVVEVKP